MTIYVGSKRAAQRVMQGISQYVERRLKLKVNRHKSAVDLARKRALLGFRFFGRDRGKSSRLLSVLCDSIYRNFARRIQHGYAMWSGRRHVVVVMRWRRSIRFRVIAPAGRVLRQPRLFA